ncbi:competence protein CoiA [Alkalihalobacterium elongatum]|uniref:competence protein CoiA n=1 Tax=Alkalihalobacterium elongatum TaxID=2675466 RepID=UPI001C1FE8AD|nr:competence protein CoiA family protein [Alkalihalobacterium elongatum]
MLIAYTEDRKRISLVQGWKIDQLEHLRKEKRFVCPVCKKPVRLKLGTIRRWHFAHIEEARCSVELEAESDYHLHGKEQLYHWLMDQKIHTLLEPYLSSINQRPDLFTFYEGRYYAIEYQCSSIPLPVFEKRTKGYLQEDIHPLWIFGGNRMTRKSSTFFSLSPIEWAALQPHPKMKNILHYFCSDNNQFFSLINIKSLSSQSALSQMITTRANDITFQDLLKPQFLQENSWKDLWLTVKKKWRYNVVLYPSWSQKYFNSYCLQRNFSPYLYPIEAGWPTKHHEWIETPPYIWQTFILIYLSTYPLEARFTFQNVYHFLKELIEKRVCSTRTLPYYDGHYSYAVMSYLQLLINRGVIKRTSSKGYFRVKEIQYPKSINEAIVRDEEFASQIKIN